MTTELLLNIAVLLFIVILSILIAMEFYISRNGQLRILIIRLFVSKVWVYGGAIILMLFDTEFIWWHRFLLNLPMAIVMFQLWKYIKTHNS